MYQFWQADNKERINKSEVKIGADELPAVTQLFTEPVHGGLLAAQLARRLVGHSASGQAMSGQPRLLPHLEDGTPAAGKFEGWPESLADFKLLDPCCGSGHLGGGFPLCWYRCAWHQRA